MEVGYAERERAPHSRRGPTPHNAKSVRQDGPWMPPTCDEYALGVLRARHGRIESIRAKDEKLLLVTDDLKLVQPHPHRDNPPGYDHEIGVHCELWRAHRVADDRHRVADGHVLRLAAGPLVVFDGILEVFARARVIVGGLSAVYPLKTARVSL